MSSKLICTLLCIYSISCAIYSYAQNDTVRGKTLGEVVISISKWEINLNEVPNKITKINRPEILRNNPQTTADLLGQTGSVFIQKSQLGGGSPMIRGFATNRVLIVADGVRMNNAIFRSGNIQNIISIDALSIETAEVIFGPGSLIYGSDAIGGVMDFHSLPARFSPDKKTLVSGSALARYSTANKENTFHADINAGFKKWAFLTSVTYSKFDDLKMGKRGPSENYLRPEYVTRQNNTDVIIPNSNPLIQRFSGYDQMNFLQKIRFKAGKDLQFQYSFTHAGTGDAPRYDRLTLYRNGALRFAEWYYGPMIWQMHNLLIIPGKKTKWYDDIKIILAYQDYKESRIERQRNNNNRINQKEEVDAYSSNLDAGKALNKGQLYYGLEYVYNKVGSSGMVTNIANGNQSVFASRYPDGSTWSTTGIYGSYKMNIDPRLTLTTGLRYAYNTLHAKFDTTFIKFPYNKTSLQKAALTGNTGVVFRPEAGWQLNGNISTGYRMPNVDDIGKFFESVPGNITVPNPGLTPEYAWNFEIGFIRNIPKKIRLELTGFHTILDNAIVRRPFTFNGQDSIDFNGTRSRVEALQNVARATVWGFQAGAELFFTEHFSLRTYANLVTGKETNDVRDEQVPLRHAPPFYGSSILHYKKNKINIEFSSVYNSKIKFEDLAPSEQAKSNIYAKNADGNPWSPGWFTLNVKASLQATKNLFITAGWENISNRRYRPYSSGIVAAGSNLILAVRASF
jgi:hemoglobin/transferrin/lactoferrin receptor protein